MGEHRVRCAEQAQQRAGRHLEDHCAQRHDGGRHQQREPRSLLNALAAARAIVVAHDGHQRVGDAEHGHEHKALQLEIHAEHGNSRLGESDEDFVHARKSSRCRCSA